MILLLACAPEAEPAPRTGDTGTIGWWYEAESAEAQAAWSTEEALAAWQTVLDGPVPTCNEVIAAWLAYYALGNGADCLGTDPGYLHDDMGCTLDNGVWLRGQTDYRYVEDDTTGRMEHVVNLDFDAVWPEGDEARLQGACGTNGAVAHPGNRVSVFEGTYVDPTQPEVLGQGVEGFWQLAVTDTDDGGISLVFDGGVGWDEAHYLFFDDLRVDGVGCASGVAQLRDPSAYWWTIDYGEGCSATGALSFAGVDAGVATLDWTGFVHGQSEALWNQVPWEGAL